MQSQFGMPGQFEGGGGDGAEENEAKQDGGWSPKLGFHLEANDWAAVKS